MANDRIDVSSWLPNLLGPLVLQIDGTVVVRRFALNFTGVTLTDDPDNDRVTLAASGGGAAPAGVNGNLQTKSGAAFAAVAHAAVGSVLRQTGAATSAFGALDLADADARTGLLPFGNGGTGLATLGTANQVLATNGAGTATEWQTVSAGGGGASPAGLDGNVQTKSGAAFAAVAHAAVGSVLRQTGAATSAFGALDLADADAVTGVLPTANQAAQTLAGDVTGPAGTTVVARVNGATVPAAGALTTGNALRATGLSTAAWSALNLAGGAGFVSGLLPLANVGGPTGTGLEKIVLGVRQAAASLLVDADVNAAAAIALAKLAAGTNGHYVQTVAGVTVSAALSVALGSQATGVLPTANQAAQTMAGDVTGTTAAAVVARVNGATVPAAGALTTGNALRATAVGALGYSALDLAGGAGFVSGALPIANQAAPTGTGLDKIVLGVRQAAASLLVDADVNAAAAIAGTKVAPNFGAQNVQTTGRVLVGATPSTVALAGIHATSGDILHTRNFPNTANFGILRTNVGDSIELGSTVAAQGDVLIKTPAGGSLSVEDASIWRFVVRSNGIKCAVPVGGYSSANLPFRFQTATIDCTAGGTITLTSTQYENPILYLTGTPAADFILVLPNNDGAVFSIRNNANVAVTVRKSGGAGVTFGGSTGMRRRWVAHNGVDYEFMEVTA